jgi:hypothetical protein
LLAAVSPDELLMDEGPPVLNMAGSANPIEKRKVKHSSPWLEDMPCLWISEPHEAPLHLASCSWAKGLHLTTWRELQTQGGKQKVSKASR